MAKLPVDRFGSMQEFLDGLESRAALSVPVRSRLTSMKQTGSPGARRILIAMGAGLLLGAVWWFGTERKATLADSGSRVGAIAVLPSGISPAIQTAPISLTG